jgi:UDP-N-acetylglucosamine:LPS N-acetylglucosamine transferase
MYDVIGYEDRMASVYAAADLLVTRAGASTIAELATVGAPAVIVPWAASADDHTTSPATRTRCRRWPRARGVPVRRIAAEGSRR